MAPDTDSAPSQSASSSSLLPDSPPSPKRPSPAYCTNCSSEMPLSAWPPTLPMPSLSKTEGRQGRERVDSLGEDNVPLRLLEHLVGLESEHVQELSALR